MDKKQVEEVMNESRLLSSIDSHFIVKYYDSFVDNNNLNIVMEYCDSGDLSKYLNINMNIVKHLTEEKIWKNFIEISLGISYLHSKKILHRDLKTLNIFLTKYDGVRIGDLGVAKVLAQDQLTHTFVGTPLYLSPEICEERPYNEKSDIWALGCILYEMSTFKHPFDASNQGALILKILKGKFEPIPREYSNDLKVLIDLMLEKNHFKRPSIFDILTMPGIIIFFI
jgi:NIMA (never in mitosis gene a)-related kinase